MNAAQGNVDAAELRKFDAVAHRFWDENGEFAPLHRLNPVRVEFVAARSSLRGARALDVGCGGGLLAESLARAGAQVTAIDLAPGMIEVARLHALESGLQIDYRLAALETLAADPQLGSGYDVITCMEMLEHVPDPQSILDACAKLLCPGGQLFTSTLNRTPAAFGLAIVGAEYVAGLLPKGTHQYRDFIKPSELARGMRTAGLDVRDISGIFYEPWKHAARLTTRTDVNYLMQAGKAE